ncbi:lutropin subunit beta [Melanotaenia boesemani]|uniref:lutropin subunit beta n=1 Tax=Melanotaenia boesemani TaxID=1250792 RepID=UPI001C0432B1|nr:lutropin subunit beta [Melanotaenia boesemani]XP_041866860.1 lutropin subunit beta [Melanotaenia boesemani]
MVAQVSTMTVPMMLLLGVSSLFWSLAPAAGFNLPFCQLVNQTVSLEKDGCPTCHRVETTICSGHCLTKDPVMKIRYRNMRQDVCTYQDFYYKTVELPDCLPGVDPTVTYPVALSCHCGGCNMATTDCTFESLQPDFCMNDIPFYY